MQWLVHDTESEQNKGFRTRTVNPPHGDLVLSGVSIRATPNLDIPGMKFDSKLTFKDQVRGIVSRVS